MIFASARLYVRCLKKVELQRLHELYGDPAIMKFIRPALTIEETKQIFDEQLLQYDREPYVGRYVIIDKTSDLFVGIFMLRRMDNFPGLEIGYAFKKEAWGKGYATEIVKRGVDYVFSATPFKVVHAFTNFKNINSKKVLTKCGFIYRHDTFEEGLESNLFSLVKKSKLVAQAT